MPETAIVKSAYFVEKMSRLTFTSTCAWSAMLEIPCLRKLRLVANRVVLAAKAVSDHTCSVNLANMTARL